ncbi:ABC transporter permease [Paenibacillus sp. N1-5-1-14]|uniref:ABC transporter permease n=1 Tax=Paenibacillus radicibacter TaxID=2972488 RepID=UPI002158ECC0|nr:ABC transporter permease [Paenibacillus radicibacter]MCR8644636.1 ABC transporter permease [Paenibacillus radicibacter]
MWTIFVTSMKRKVKNPIIIVNYILLPLLLILILGNALSVVFESDEGSKTAAAVSLKQVKTVVVNEDSGDLGTNIMKFLTSEDNKVMFDVTVSTNKDEAKKQLESGAYEQFIYLPADLTSGFKDKKDSSVTIYGKDSNIDKVNITGLTLSAFGDGYLAMNVLSQNNEPIMFTHVYTNLLTSGKALEGGQSSSQMTALSYYGVTMLVLILFYGLANTMNFIQEEYSEALGERYLISPVSKKSLILGQLFTGCSISILQGLIIVYFAKWFFQVSYGENMLVALLIVFVGAVFFNALGLILGVIARRFKQVDNIVTLLIPIMTFVGGGFIKVDFGGLKSFSVNEIFQRPLFDYIQQGTLNLMPLFTSLALAIGFIGISVFALTRREAR